MRKNLHDVTVNRSSKILFCRFLERLEKLNIQIPKTRFDSLKISLDEEFLCKTINFSCASQVRRRRKGKEKEMFEAYNQVKNQNAQSIR